MKYRMRTLMLMLLICWASQSSAQPTQAKKLPRFDYLVRGCDVARGENMKVAPTQTSAKGSRLGPVKEYIVPISTLFNGLYYNQTSGNRLGLPKLNLNLFNKMEQNLAKEIKIIHLPKHGTLLIDEVVIKQLGGPGKAYAYLPDVNYQGKDKAVFAVPYQGKNYKIVIDFHIRYDYIDDDDRDKGELDLQEELCSTGQFKPIIKLNPDLPI